MERSQLIRVADAPLLDARGGYAKFQSIDLGATILTRARSCYFSVLLIWALINFAQYLYVPSIPALIQGLVYFRYALWPIILVGLALHIRAYGWSRMGDALWRFMPFFSVGIVSGVLGYSPVDSAHELTFWFLGVLGAALVGSELEPRRTMHLLFWILTVMLASSAAFVLACPRFGLALDYRASSGFSWNGLFPNKNFLGLISAYGLVFAVIVPTIPVWIRIAAASAAAVCLVRTDSQGAVVTAFAAFGFLWFVTLLRRSRLASGARSIVLTLLILSVAGLFLAAMRGIFQLTGRDSTLTGRTDIWPVFFARAAEHWFLGAGPGSFTHASTVTADLVYRFQYLGEIATPHNMFIAAFGEVGLIGLVTMLVPLVYLAVVYPFQRRGTVSLLTAAVAFTMMVGGMIETREVYGLGMNMLLLVLLLAASREERIDTPSEKLPPKSKTSHLDARVLG